MKILQFKMHKGLIWERQREVTDGKITIQNAQRFNLRKAERSYRWKYYNSKCTKVYCEKIRDIGKNITIQIIQRFNFRKAERRYIGGNITIQNAQRFNLRKAKRSYRWKTLQFKMHKGLIWERQREVIDKNITIQNA